MDGAPGFVGIDGFPGLMGRNGPAGHNGIAGCNGSRVSINAIIETSKTENLLGILLKSMKEHKNA